VSNRFTSSNRPTCAAFVRLGRDALRRHRAFVVRERRCARVAGSPQLPAVRQPLLDGVRVRVRGRSLAWKRRPIRCPTSSTSRQLDHAHHVAIGLLLPGMRRSGFSTMSSCGLSRSGAKLPSQGILRRCIGPISIPVNATNVVDSDNSRECQRLQLASAEFLVCLRWRLLCLRSDACVSVTSDQRPVWSFWV
jgi:hypothetical protein